MKEPIIEIAEALGFKQIESRNPYMLSFTNEVGDPRINVYFTTMTVQVQYKDGGAEIYREINIEDFEKILMSIE